MRKVVVTLLALVTFVLLLGADRRADVADAESPGSTITPLLTCPDVDANGSILSSDILAVVRHYRTSSDRPGYAFLYDINANLVVLSDDILAVVRRYRASCPLVDVQVAQATLAIIDPTYSNVLCGGTVNEPALCGGDPQFLAEDPIFLASRGYHRASSDVSGQGIHYIKVEYWDGTFNPTRPEGLVYHGGKLAAQLYVTDGTAVGWGTHEATSYPPPAVPHNVDLEEDADGPQCAPVACSWDGTYDGWHLHYYLCSTKVGTTAAIALPGFATTGACATYGGGDPECTSPIITTPCYRWGQNVGWMGHLWNHLPNANLLPDDTTRAIEDAGDPDGQGPCTDGIDNGNDGLTDGNDPDCKNGRFADCFPDSEGWKAFNCPA